eukprot:gene27844-33625_t
MDDYHILELLNDLTISRSHQTQLFLGDLSYFCTEEDIFALFRGYGHILSVQVRRGARGDSLMHGFVTLESSDFARKAIADLDGTDFMGRTLRVQLSVDGQRLPISSKELYVQVHVSFISKQLRVIVTERVLRDLFSVFGHVADVTIKKHAAHQKDQRQSGYGFVYFFSNEAASRALFGLKGRTVDGITLDVSMSHRPPGDRAILTQLPPPHAHHLTHHPSYPGHNVPAHSHAYPPAHAHAHAQAHTQLRYPDYPPVPGHAHAPALAHPSYPSPSTFPTYPPRPSEEYAGNRYLSSPVTAGPTVPSQSRIEKPIKAAPSYEDVHAYSLFHR